VLAVCYRRWGFTGGRLVLSGIYATGLPLKIFPAARCEAHGKISVRGKRFFYFMFLTASGEWFLSDSVLFGLLLQAGLQGSWIVKPK
jgi:hypothetical protein